MINVERRKVSNIGVQRAAMREISEVYSLSGHRETIAILRVARNDDLAS